MSVFLRKTISHPALALGSTLLWGLVELLALARSRYASRARGKA